MDLHLRQLESEPHVVEWVCRLYQVPVDFQLSTKASGRTKQSIKEMKSGRETFVRFRGNQIRFDYVFEYGISVRCMGVYLLASNLYV